MYTAVRILFVTAGAFALGPSCALQPQTYALPNCTPGQTVTLNLSTGMLGPAPPPGRTDPIWRVMWPPHDAFTTTTGGGPWYAPGSTPPFWIQPHPAGTPQTLAGGTWSYVYGARFSTPLSPSAYQSVTINGIVAADNKLAMKLNGTVIASCTNAATCFAYPTTINSPPASAFTTSGSNLLTVEVNNVTTSWTGLYVRAAVKAKC
jgi:hypothetical protein